MNNVAHPRPRRKHGSLFSGIEGFGLGFERAGFALRWHSEIEPWCNRVLERHWPEVPNVGDATAIDPRSLEPVDVISFGSPCQDLSVAGRRAGLDGARSSLFFTAARIIEQCRPSLAIWENVPGAFSSNDGRDFLAVLNTLADIGATDIAWRVIDSKYSGVPQQRRRIFLVADFGGQRAGEVLFESEGCGGHPTPGRAERESAAWGSRDGLARSLGAVGGGQDYGANKGTLAFAHALTAATAATEDGTGRGTPLAVVMHPDAVHRDGVAKRDSPDAGGRLRKRDAGQGVRQDDLSYTLNAGEPPTLFLIDDVRGGGDVPAYTLDSVSQPAVMVLDHQNMTTRPDVGTLHDQTGRGNMGGIGFSLSLGSAVRRFTPTECERLQGFPDGHTCLCGAADDYRTILRVVWNSAQAQGVPEWESRRLLHVCQEALLQCLLREAPSSRGGGTESSRWAEACAAALQSVGLPALRNYDEAHRQASRRRGYGEQFPNECDAALRFLSRDGALGDGQPDGASLPSADHEPRSPYWQDCRLAGLDFVCTCPDGPRYRACGNAVSVTVAYWLAVRAMAVLDG